MFVDGLSSKPSKPSIVRCQLRGGDDTVQWSWGALGLPEGCQISGARMAGLALLRPSTAPLVTNNTFRDSRWGIHIWDDVDADWDPGESNVLENMGEEDVKDWRQK